MIVAIFDLETTGIPKHDSAKMAVQPKAIEFGGILVDGETVLRELSLLINPEEKLEAIITKITGLVDEDLSDKPTFIEIEPQLREFFEAADAVISHNLPFDSNVLDIEARRHDLPAWPWDKKLMLCTVQEHAEDWGRRPKLLELYEHYTGEPLQQTHRALDDVNALLTVCRESGVLDDLSTIARKD